MGGTRCALFSPPAQASPPAPPLLFLSSSIPQASPPVPTSPCPHHKQKIHPLHLPLASCLLPCPHQPLVTHTAPPRSPSPRHQHMENLPAHLCPHNKTHATPFTSPLLLPPAAASCLLPLSQSPTTGDTRCPSPLPPGLTTSRGDTRCPSPSPPSVPPAQGNPPCRFVRILTTDTRHTPPWHLPLAFPPCPCTCPPPTAGDTRCPRKLPNNRALADSQERQLVVKHLKSMPDK